MLNWILFFFASVASYICIAVLGQLTGSNHATVGSAVLSLFKPIPFALLILGNIFWVAAVYYGFLNTRSAIPAVIAIGVITDFIYSVIFLNDPITFTHILGIIVIFVGIYLIR